MSNTIVLYLVIAFMLCVAPARAVLTEILRFEWCSGTNANQRWLVQNNMISRVSDGLCLEAGTDQINPLSGVPVHAAVCIPSSPHQTFVYTYNDTIMNAAWNQPLDGIVGAWVSFSVWLNSWPSTHWIYFPETGFLKPHNIDLCLELSAPQTGHSLVAETYSNDMVLQWDKPRLHGWSHSNGAIITVQIDSSGDTYTATAAADGLWTITMPARTSTTLDKHNISVSSSDVSDGSVTLTGAMFGVVVLCSGQSNMAMSVDASTGGQDEATAAELFAEQVRLFTVSMSFQVNELEDLFPAPTKWAKAGRYTVPAFSAVCWWAGRHLAQQHPTVPIGLLLTSVGGTGIELWTAPRAESVCPCVPKAHLLWNGMIAPLRHTSFAAVAWYQGENNAGDAPCYTCALTAMISAWRTEMSLPGMPFVIVQLAPMWAAASRFAQTDAVAASQPAGLACLVDLGDPDNPVHPLVKEPVGERVYRQLQRLVFGDNTVVAEGPIVTACFLQNPAPNAVVRCLFGNSNGPILFHAVETCPQNQFCDTWAVDVDGAWQSISPSFITQDGGFILSFPLILDSNISAVQHVRYLWADWPLPQVFNMNGLPARPFVVAVIQSPEPDASSANIEPSTVFSMSAASTTPLLAVVTVLFGGVRSTFV